MNFLHYPVIQQAFETFYGALKELTLHVHVELRDLPLWIDNGQGVLVNNRILAIHALEHLHYLKDKPPEATYACVGAIGCTGKTIELIDSLNAAKDAFKGVVGEFKHLNKRDPTQPARDALAAAGYSGIKLKEVYRHVKYLGYHPRRIAWLRVQKSSNRRITIMEARQALSKWQGVNIDMQLNQLKQLDKNARLTVVIPIPPVWQANVASFKNELGLTVTKTVFCSLPLFYLHNDSLPETKVSLKNDEPASRKARSDKRLSKMEFPSIHAHFV